MNHRLSLSFNLREPLIKVAFFSVLLALVKLAFFVMTGSLLLLTSFFDSLVDSVMSWLNSKIFTLAREKPDEQHPYGHGGIEVFTGVVQGSLLCMFAIFILLEILSRQLAPRGIEGGAAALLRQNYLWGALSLGFAAAAGYLLQAYLGRVQQQRSSKLDALLSLAADRAHYRGDFWVNAFSAVGLLLVWLSGREWLDSVFAAFGAVLMMRTGLPILKTTYRHISQQQVALKLQDRMVELIDATDERIVGIHCFRTRQIGPDMFADFHLKLPRGLLLGEAHRISESVSQALKSEFQRLDVIIHLDPDDEPDDDLWQRSRPFAQTLRSPKS